MRHFRVVQVVDEEGDTSLVGNVGLKECEVDGMTQLRFTNNIGADKVEHFWPEEIVEVTKCSVSPCHDGYIKSGFGDYPCPYCDSRGWV